MTEKIYKVRFCRKETKAHNITMTGKEWKAFRKGKLSDCELEQLYESVMKSEDTCTVIKVDHYENNIRKLLKTGKVIEKVVKVN